jgi:hypothetical protein
MSVLAWWVVPVAVALLVGAAVNLWGRRPRIRGSFEEVEYFRRFLGALEHQQDESTGRGDTTTA